MATLVTKVKNISGSTTDLTTNADILSYLGMGVRYTINSLPEPLLLPYTTTVAITSTGYRYQNNKVLLVTRAGYVCAKVSASLAYNLTKTDSMHYPTSSFPVFYDRAGQIFIKPDPTGGGSDALIHYVNIKTLANGLTTNTTTGHKLDPIEHIIVHYAAGHDLMNQARFYAYKATSALSLVSTTGGNAADALAKARDLIDNSTALSAGQDAEYWLNDEDTEMVTNNVNVARQEVERAMAEIRMHEVDENKSTKYLETTVGLMNQAQQQFNLASESLKNYIQSDPAIMALNLAGRSSNQ